MKRSWIKKIICAFIILGLIFFLFYRGFDDEDSVQDTGELIVYGIIFLSIIILTKKNQGKFNHYKLNFGSEGKTLPNVKDINYYREIPCNNDIFEAFWLIYHYELTSAIDCYKGLLGAVLLDWLQKDYISIKEMSNNNYKIDLSNIQDSNLNKVEIKLLEILKEASKDKILEYNEFRNWSKEHPYPFANWFKEVIEFETERLEEGNLLVNSTENRKVFLLGIMQQPIKTIQQPLREAAISLLGLKKFLLDYSLIDEREAKEVIIWENYLVFAQLLGIADKINKQLHRVYPDFSQLFSMTSITYSFLDELDKELKWE